MSRESLVFFIGFLIFLVPFLGFPDQYKRYFLIGAGVILMLIGFSLRRAAFFRSIQKDGGERRSEAFTESVRPTKIEPIEPTSHNTSAHI